MSGAVAAMGAGNQVQAIAMLFAAISPGGAFNPVHPALRVVRDNPSIDSHPIVARTCADAASVWMTADTSHDISEVESSLAVEAELMRLAAVTGRGAARSPESVQRFHELVAKLEGLAQSDVNALDGAWKLVYATCPVYRSSPFFWAFSQLAGPLAEPLFSITDGLPFYRVGTAQQNLIDTLETGKGKLVSSIEVELYVFDALVPPLRNVMTTTAKVRLDAADPLSLILELQTTEVKESALPFSDMVVFPTATIFNSLKRGSATVRLNTSYLSPRMRLARSSNGGTLVYVPSTATAGLATRAAAEPGDLEAQAVRLAAAMNRGAAHSAEDLQQFKSVVKQLEDLGQPDVSGGALDGSWKLIYSSCPPYRSSPFFWAFNQLAGSLAKPLVSITDGLPFYRVGTVQQVLTDTASKVGNGKLVSRVEVEVYIFDALLPPLRSVMTTTAKVCSDAADVSSLILDLQTTEVKESALPFSDMVSFPIDSVFNGLKNGSARVRLRTSYLSNTMRIAHSPDGAFFVYVPS